MGTETVIARRIARKENEMTLYTIYVHGPAPRARTFLGMRNAMSYANAWRMLGYSVDIEIRAYLSGYVTSALATMHFWPVWNAS